MKHKNVCLVNVLSLKTSMTHFLQSSNVIYFRQNIFTIAFKASETYQIQNHENPLFFINYKISIDNCDIVKCTLIQSINVYLLFYLGQIATISFYLYQFHIN